MPAEVTKICISKKIEIDIYIRCVAKKMEDLS